MNKPLHYKAKEEKLDALLEKSQQTYDELTASLSKMQGYEGVVNGFSGVLNDLDAQLKEVSQLVPIGTILPWHQNILNTSLKEQWALCNGQKVNDSTSPLNGQILPDLNGKRLFLRGGNSSGKVEQEDWKGLIIASQQGNYQHTQMGVPKTGDWSKGLFGGYWKCDLDKNNQNIANRLMFKFGKNGEVRPKNMSVVFIIKIK